VSALRTLFAVFLLGVLAVPAGAVNPDEVLKDPALEARARALSLEIRCLVCQNQSIDDSNADLAKDLRRLVRQRLKAGDSDAAIKDYLVKRYGDFVLLRPPMRGDTFFLWYGPFAILLLGGLGIFFYMRHRKPTPEAGATAESETLTAEEKKRIDALMREKS
jgi:cytochrome c-type biogenesis protein CcmH